MHHRLHRTNNRQRGEIESIFNGERIESAERQALAITYAFSSASLNSMLAAGYCFPASADPPMPSFFTAFVAGSATRITPKRIAAPPSHCRSESFS